MALLYVFHQAGGDGADGQLRYAVFDGTSWSADIPLNIAMSESPAAVPWAGGITVFHQGSNYDGQLLYTFSPDGQNWGGDTLVPVLALANQPSAVVYNGLLYAFHQADEDVISPPLRLAVFDGKNWSSDIPFLGNTSSTGAPSAVAWAGGMTVFHQGSNSDGQLYYTFSPDGQNWGGDTLVPVLALSAEPSAVVYNGLLYVFHQGGPGGFGVGVPGYGGDGQLHYAVFDGTNWSADIPLNIAMSHSPSAVAWAGGIAVFHQGPNSDGQLYYTFSPDGQHWGGDTLVPVLALTFSPSCVVY